MKNAKETTHFGNQYHTGYTAVKEHAKSHGWNHRNSDGGKLCTTNAPVSSQIDWKRKRERKLKEEEEEKREQDIKDHEEKKEK